MNEDIFNMEIRKFLKHVGVTSQREIEQAVRGGVASGSIRGDGKVTARVVLTIDGLDVKHVIESDIALE